MSAANKVLLLVLALMLGGYAYQKNQSRNARLAAEAAELAKVSAALERQRADAENDGANRTQQEQERYSNLRQQDAAIFNREERIRKNLAVAKELSSRIMSFYNREKRWPSALDMDLPTQTDPQPVSTRRVTMPDEGSIAVIFMNGEKKPETIHYEPAEDAHGNIRWQCSSPDIPDVGHIMVNDDCRHTE